MPGLVLAATLAAAAQPAAAPPARGNIEFARGELAGWSMKATTVFTTYPWGPVIDRMLCEVERNGLSVMTWRQGGMAFTFGGSITRHGREHRLTYRNARALELDGTRFEVRQLFDWLMTNRYTDVTYPRPEGPRFPEGFVYTGVRREGSALWLQADNLNNELLAARMLRVGFRDGDTGPLSWLDVPLTGLPDALRWCREAMSSPAASRYRPA